MSYADIRFIENCRDILENGVWDTDQNNTHQPWRARTSPSLIVQKAPCPLGSHLSLGAVGTLSVKHKGYW